MAENKESMKFLPSTGLTEKLTNEGLSAFADCHSAMKGIFLGKFSNDTFTGWKSMHKEFKIYIFKKILDWGP